jgi:hypothetical protein
MPEIENPYAQAAVENFRRPPPGLRPLKSPEQAPNGAELEAEYAADGAGRVQ